MLPTKVFAVASLMAAAVQSAVRYPRARIYNKSAHFGLKAVRFSGKREDIELTYWEEDLKLNGRHVVDPDGRRHRPQVRRGAGGPHQPHQHGHRGALGRGTTMGGLAGVPSTWRRTAPSATSWSRASTRNPRSPTSRSSGSWSTTARGRLSP